MPDVPAAPTAPWRWALAGAPVSARSPAELLLQSALTCRLACQARDWPTARRELDRALDHLAAIEAVLATMPPAGTPRPPRADLPPRPSWRAPPPRRRHRAVLAHTTQERESTPRGAGT